MSLRLDPSVHISILQLDAVFVLMPFLAHVGVDSTQEHKIRAEVGQVLNTLVS